MTVNFLNERKMEFMNAFILAGYNFFIHVWKRFHGWIADINKDE